MTRVFDPNLTPPGLPSLRRLASQSCRRDGMRKQVIAFAEFKKSSIAWVSLPGEGTNRAHAPWQRAPGRVLKSLYQIGGPRSIQLALKFNFESVAWPKPLYFLTTSMCFLPKKRASIDHAPGPIIARLAPKPDRMIAVHGSADPEKTTHSCVAATKRPIYGVPSPITRRTDAIDGSATSAKSGPASSRRNASRKRMVPTRNRWRSRPVPGHPPAKVENKRCTTI